VEVAAPGMKLCGISLKTICLARRAALVPREGAKPREQRRVCNLFPLPGRNFG
jgi:hypothetical protein